MSLHRGWPLSLLLLVVLMSPWAVSCRAPADRHASIVGKWRGVRDQDFAKDTFEFYANGSCQLRDEGQRASLYCRWSPQPDGRFKIRAGILFPSFNWTGTVTGDELTLDPGDGLWISYVRPGSQQERNAALYFHGKALIESGNFQEGMKQWKLAADQGYASAANSLAWVYATAKDPKLRDGKQAVLYAEKAVRRLRDRRYLETLAAALARDGQFERAAQVEREALSLFHQENLYKADLRRYLEGGFKDRIASYEAGQAYTQP
jgi:tetratricopeptide (TPR) repeat protein